MIVPDTVAIAAHRIAAIEAIVCREVGRGIGGILAATRGNLGRAAESLADSPAPRVGIITGFYVPQASPPAAETDGPVGAGHLAAGLLRAGIPVRLATDEPCAATLKAAVAAAGAAEGAPVDTVPVGNACEAAMAVLTQRWVDEGLTHVIAIERCGQAADGRAYNMSGYDVTPWTAPLDRLFLAGAWKRIAIGDGGNEIGMGAAPQDVIAREVPNGAQIACRTSCDTLIAVGVSNWGAYGLLAALACLRPRQAAAFVHTLRPAKDLAILKEIVHRGGAIDGVLRRRVLCVDGYAPAVHGDVIRAIREAAELD